jgi:hypothetical protein
VPNGKDEWGRARNAQLVRRAERLDRDPLHAVQAPLDRVHVRLDQRCGAACLGRSAVGHSASTVRRDALGRCYIRSSTL